MTNRLSTLCALRASQLATLIALASFSITSFSQQCAKDGESPGAGYMVRNGYVYFGQFALLKNELTWTGTGKYDYDKTSGIMEVDGADAQSIRKIPPSEKANSCGILGDTNSHYGRDNTQVFFDGRVIPAAHPDTFEVLDGYYAKDAENVFMYGTKVADADPATFQTLNAYFGKDKNHVFFANMILEKADPKSFEPVGAGYGKDTAHVFRAIASKGQIVSEADPKSFVDVGNGFSKDAWHVFYANNNSVNIVENADPATFTSSRTQYVKDDKHVFFVKDGKEVIVVNGADSQTFEDIWPDYFKDKHAVYFGAKRLTTRTHEFHFPSDETNYATDGRNWFFHDQIISGSHLNIVTDNRRYATTKKHVYFKGELIPGANPATFIIEPRNREISRDKYHVYYRTVLIPFLVSSTFDQVYNEDTQNKIQKYLEGRRRSKNYERSTKISSAKIAQKGMNALSELAPLEFSMRDVLSHGNLADTKFLLRKLGLDIEIPVSDVKERKTFQAIIRKSPNYLYSTFSYDVVIDNARNTSRIDIRLPLASCPSLESWGLDWHKTVTDGMVSDAIGSTASLYWAGKRSINLSVTSIFGSGCEAFLTQKIPGRFSFITSPARRKSSGNELALSIADILGAGDLRDYEKTAKSLHTEFSASSEKDGLLYKGWIVNKKIIQGIHSTRFFYYGDDTNWVSPPSFSVVPRHLSDRTVNLSMSVDRRLVCLPPLEIIKSLERKRIHYQTISSKNDVLTLSTEGDNQISLTILSENGCSSFFRFDQITDISHRIASVTVFDLVNSLDPDANNALNAATLAKIDLLIARININGWKHIDLFTNLPVDATPDRRGQANILAERIRDVLISKDTANRSIGVIPPTKEFYAHPVFPNVAAVIIDVSAE